MESVKYDFFTNPLFIFTVLIGGSVLLLIYFINLFRHQEVAEKSKTDKSTAHSEKKKDPPVSGKRKKKVPESRWTGKHEKHTFANPWLLVSLKGHTGNILDMDFSSNGKYLTSCDDEDPDPGGDTTQQTIASESNTENIPIEPSPSPKGLSRRQRKNRRREDTSPSDSQKLRKPKSKKTAEGSPVLTKKQVMSTVPLKQYRKLNVSEKVFMELLHNYLLTLDQMMVMGYPIQSSLEPTLVVLYKSPGVPIFPVRKTVFDVNAREFVPKNDWSSNDSGQGSGSSSDSGENFDGEESSSSDQDSTASYPENPVDEPPSELEGSFYARTCSRCARNFYTTADKYITQEKCYYHYGRLTNINNSGDKRETNLAYDCCTAKIGSKGCTESKLHVWSGLHVGMNGLYDDFILTKQRKNPPPDGNYGVYSLDCEMCYTVRGLELTKITVVGTDGRLVYDSFVKPDDEIVDYNTRFSGITAKDLKRNPTKSLKEVQNDLMGFINADTILIGHGLENDLRALRIVHYINVDTAYSFPHFNGLPYRRSLKSLTASYLRREIQNNKNGHNSYEDASACMELMLWRVRRDFRRHHHHHAQF